MFGFLRRLFRRFPAAPAELEPEASFVVHADDQVVRCTRPNGDAEEVAWSDLRAVILETNDLGPFACDVMWVLLGTDSGCVVPQGATGESELIDRLVAMPDFDHEAMIAAASSTESARFLCWEKPSA